MKKTVLALSLAVSMLALSVNTFADTGTDTNGGASKKGTEDNRTEEGNVFPVISENITEDIICGEALEQNEGLIEQNENAADTGKTKNTAANEDTRSGNTADLESETTASYIMVDPYFAKDYEETGGFYEINVQPLSSYALPDMGIDATLIGWHVYDQLTGEEIDVVDGSITVPENGFMAEPWYIKPIGHSISLLEGGDGITLDVIFIASISALYNGYNFETGIYGSSGEVIEAETFPFDLGGRTNITDLPEPINGTTFGFTLSCPLRSHQLSANVDFKFNKETFDTYSLMQYGQSYLNSPDSSQTGKNVIKALLNYGGYAQEYFGEDYFTNNTTLANSVLDQTTRNSVKSVSVPYRYRYTFDDVLYIDEDGIEYIGSSLILGSKTDLRQYFRLADGAKPEDYTFKIDGETVALKQKDTDKDRNIWYLEKTAVGIKDLDVFSTFSVVDNKGYNLININYAPLSYALEVLIKDNPPEKLANVLRALYAYWDVMRTV